MMFDQIEIQGVVVGQSFVTLPYPKKLSSPCNVMSSVY
jgi:hypothetical protein